MYCTKSVALFQTGVSISDFGKSASKFLYSPHIDISQLILWTADAPEQPKRITVTSHERQSVWNQVTDEFPSQRASNAGSVSIWWRHHRYVQLKCGSWGRIKKSNRHGEPPNWLNSHIPECSCSICHNAPFKTEMCTFLFWMEHCWIWNGSILGFVKLVHSFLGYLIFADKQIPPHDDVIKWKHFPRNWPFVRGIHRSGPGEFPTQRPVTPVTWINRWVNNHEAGDLRRYRAHYDVIVMDGVLML